MCGDVGAVNTFSFCSNEQGKMAFWSGSLTEWAPGNSRAASW